MPSRPQIKRERHLFLANSVIPLNKWLLCTLKRTIILTSFCKSSDQTTTICLCVFVLCNQSLLWSLCRTLGEHRPDKRALTQCMGHRFCYVPQSVSRLCPESAKQTASPVTTSSWMQHVGLSAPLDTTHLAHAQINNVWLSIDAPASPRQRAYQSGCGLISSYSQTVTAVHERC